MNYQIRITKTEANPNYEAELKEARRPRYHFERQTLPEPQREFVKDVLVTELTEAQYKKIKAEIIKEFE
jgi:hypothetical protein